MPAPAAIAAPSRPVLSEICRSESVNGSAERVRQALADAGLAGGHRTDDHDVVGGGPRLSGHVVDLIESDTTFRLEGG